MLMLSSNFKISGNADVSRGDRKDSRLHKKPTS